MCVETVDSEGNKLNDCELRREAQEPKVQQVIKCVPGEQPSVLKKAVFFASRPWSFNILRPWMCPNEEFCAVNMAHQEICRSRWDPQSKLEL